MAIHMDNLAKKSDPKEKRDVPETPPITKTGNAQHTGEKVLASRRIAEASPVKHRT